MWQLGTRLLLFVPILLGATPVSAAPASDDIGGEEQPGEEIVLSFPRDEASLNEMFREVEELMEDTQYKLRNAVREVRCSLQTKCVSFWKASRYKLLLYLSSSSAIKVFLVKAPHCPFCCNQLT